MTVALIQFVISVVIIVFSGTILVRSADVIADVTGIGKLLVGSILLAGATSLPELMIGLNAVWIDLPDIAMGDLVGSSLFNLLILALADLLHRSRGAVLSRAAAGHALAGTLSIAITAVVGMGILFEHEVGTSWNWRIGPGSIAVFLAYFFGIRLMFYDSRVAVTEGQSSLDTVEKTNGLRGAIAKYVLAAVVIFATAPLLTRSAGTIADESGLGGTFVGTTFVAIATSLPELVATITAVRIGAFDLAIGNIFGSNTFNMLMLVPLDLAFPGSLLAAVSMTHAITAFSVILITSVVILGQLYRVEKRVFFLEPDATLVITLILIALALVYFAG